MSKEYIHSDCEQGMSGCNSVDVCVKECDCEIKADIVVSEAKSVRIWGQVKTCNGQPVANALIKLLEVVNQSGGCEYLGVAHTVTDCKGFYQFDLCSDEIGCCYKILVSKAITGCERSICQESSCTPCEDSRPSCDSCNPCAPSYACKPTKKCNSR